MPNVLIDSGVSRRLLAYYFSEFVKETEKVNEAKHKYLRDDDLLTSLKDDDDLLNAFTDILIQYCKNWCENKAPAIPASYTEAKQTVRSANNKTEDFIYRYLVINGNEFDRILKDKMREYY
jgi:predicted choloylglycine hydrolase